ncbi:MAG: xanthine dehydrogenase family protein molybdopterin-binding subunit [Alphaproteobacteria bacterium]|jgi:carbon-monoxide dehydrogenase large subunit|nr:xanthine dehydrogenase family protein molybdopterin-binding subunit [Alphaproteobacteria bacterium]
MTTGIGKSVRRVEDARLLTGQGEFSDDLNLAGQAYAVFLRSPHAHVRIQNIETAAAKAAPGVLAVLTGTDFLADGLEPLRHRGNPKDVELKNRDGSEIFYTPLHPIVTDKVRRVGEIVAIAVAETQERARDAAELIEIDYQVLPAVANVDVAMADGAALVWDEVPGNLVVDDLKGDPDAVRVAFEAAAHVVEIESYNNRVTGVPMEPRAAIGEYDPGADHYTLNAGGQGVVRFRTELAPVLGVEPAQIRVVSRDVGGGYGTRNSTYSEFALVLWAAKHCGRPVKWTATRSESFLSDYCGRNMLTKGALALDAGGRFLAMRTENIADLGTHTVTFVPLSRGPSVTTGVYRIPLVDIVSKGVLTNTLPTTAYRGAGRPEAMFVIERLIDLAAKEIGIDPVELRRRNLIPSSGIPYDNKTGMIYDSGEFERGMDLALEIADWDGFPARRAAARERRMLAGIGLANYIETATGWPVERGEVEVKPEGIVELVIGTQSSGQGHETSYPQVVSELLGIPFHSIRLKTGDTDFVKIGAGSHSSRSMRLAGHLFGLAIDQIVDQGKSVAAEVLEAAAADIEYTDGAFRVAGTDRALGLFDAAAAAGENGMGPLAGDAEVTELIAAFPNGTHVAEVEVDPETGAVRVVRHTVVDDVGRVINPMIVHGQTHGGLAQGVGQALMEHGVYDQAGQLLSGSFMDYAMPRADHFPSFDVGFNEVPAPSTRLGVKGGGEGGTTGALPVVINAIVDALAEYGVTHIEMPATPERVWRAIREARNNFT